MTENETGGSRWESNQADTGAEDDNRHGNVLLADPPPADFTAPAPVASRRPDWLTRSAAFVAAGVAAALLVGGGAGFAIGRATSDSSAPGQVTNQGFDPRQGFRGGPGADFDGDGDGPRGGRPPQFDQQGQSGQQSRPGSAS